MTFMKNLAKKNLLWDKSFERDACGMGFVSQVEGEASHTLVDYALTMLERMNHRGGTGAEPDTGDGAGILMSMPHSFFKEVASSEEIFLPNKHEYAAGMFFLPKEKEKKMKLQNALVMDIEQAGYRVIWERDVPFRFEHCGPGAQEVMPSFVQIFLEKPVEVTEVRDFEDRLYRLRRKLEKTYAPQEMFICSLSSQTICYKGMLHAYQVRDFYPDLTDEKMQTHICVVHSRFSTNTFPSWDRAQPFRFIAHNGEINTLRGAENWMKSHDIEVYNEENSDSAKLENCMEYLYRNGRDIPESLMMMIPASFSKEAGLDEETAAFYEYATSFIAPWDGPAGLVFTDGTKVGAALDRNGLRPSRYSLTKDKFLVVSSESGVIDFEPSRVVEKGVLGPGDVLLVDTQTGVLLKNEEVKKMYSSKNPYKEWLDNGFVTIEELNDGNLPEELNEKERRKMWQLAGYTDEIIRTVVLPMAENGEEPVVAMGYDSPLAILSEKPQSLFTYFKQQFAQVTNPPIDAIREQLVIGTQMYLGRVADLREDSPENCRKVKLFTPVLSTRALEKLKALQDKQHRTAVVSTLYQLYPDVPNRLEHALKSFFKEVEELVDSGYDIIVLSDRKPSEEKMALPILLATSGLHNYMVEKGKGGKFSIVIDSAEVCEVHHFATLIGFGASAIHPYGAYETIGDFDFPDLEKKIENYRHAAEKGIVKVMSRMGISTVCGYHGAQLFEAVGLSNKVVEEFFTGTVSRIGGLSLGQIEEEYLQRHERAYGARSDDFLPSGGSYQLKADGEHHLFNPNTIYQFQQAVRTGDYKKYKEYTELLHAEMLQSPTNLRHMWEFSPVKEPVALDEVEPVEEIVKRFKVGAMSYGSLSEEAHTTIAEAMNAIGGKSNSGEGGEHPNRFHPREDGVNLNSKIKQVASGRFGVNAQYLMSAEEIQIKMAQGAKPGEGGQLPGNKVFPWVAEIRGSTPGVRLISPPPHHDIYSIEDLAQLIYDLKTINPYAKINIKLVSSTGVGTIATGCVKAGADVVVISGYDGGTGASPRNSLRDAGLPWEIGLAEAHQTLSENHLRNRMILETDGKLMSARDVAVAAMLGAEEYSFASLALVSIGCVMMRVCSLNTCPVGVATQNPDLRKHFVGKPEHVVHAMTFIAEELREIMSSLGYRTVDELIGQTESLSSRFIAKGKAKSLDFSRMLGKSIGIKRKTEDPFKEPRQWKELDAFAQSAIEQGNEVAITQPINNVNRTVGARMGGWIAERFGNYTLKAGLLKYEYKGIAGQSFAAFATQGMELKLIGEANDYIAKGLSGARVIVVPPEDASYEKGNSPIVGNVSCFGANKGEAYFLGRAGERFCVRNSGANVVVEGVGDHGCEYMTGGVAVILGTTGHNFGAGMSGGVAYVYDKEGTFEKKCNLEMVDLFKLYETTGDEQLKTFVENHVRYTNSEKAKQLLANWEEEEKYFVKVYPRDFHKIIDITQALEKEGHSGDELQEKAFAQAVKGGV